MACGGNMKQTLKAREIKTGYHPSGYRIDKNASAMNRYTHWTISENGEWIDPQPVCFDSMPVDGWMKAEKFTWDENKEK
jgi:hypothetical protein